MIYFFSMKKVKIKYESYIFQEEHIDRFNEEIIGELFINHDGVNISCLLNTSEGKEKTIFTFQDECVLIKRENFTLIFDLNKMIECENKTQYGTILLVTKLKKYLKLDNQYVINYDLLINDESIGSYVVKISYEEMN